MLLLLTMIDKPSMSGWLNLGPTHCHDDNDYNYDDHGDHDHYNDGGGFGLVS